MPEKNLTLEMVARTDVGRERAINEDNFLVSPDYRNADWILPAEAYADANSIMVVADGMGGLNAGEVASRITVDGIRECLNIYDKLPATDESISNMLGKAILCAHKKVVSHSTQHAETQGMGSTVVIGLIAHMKIHIAWSGDSRAYVFRQGRLLQLTTDHSYVQSLVDEGKLTPEQAFLHPDSNVILQSIGDADRAPKPDYVSLPLCNDDVYLFCSDGVTGMLQDAEIEALLSTHAGHLSQCAEKIVEAANGAGGIDNITVLLSKVVAGAPASVQQAGAGGATLDSFGKTSLSRKRSPAKATWYFISALVLLLTMGFFVAPMLIRRNAPPARHDSLPVRPAPPVKNSPAPPADKKATDSPPIQRRQEQQRQEKPRRQDTTAGKKPALVLPDIPRPKTDTAGLTPIVRDKHEN